ncbi:PREDICTED: N-alpha-acetyltransferase 25, NatB auxiliary subunit [Nanorana parkeri]|uniref:N-alpha-acetyltransferase 25, NatB auxiliary subunit n=1 Tax=Nanorana parkeri TaxID=125878 RepID=UPI0008550365|nr:PREDICTED: N-alpha-acetyltransferase 25, NatB auxiliary subunit [Nanorana parkeri]
MAARGHVQDPNDRRLRPIYDYLDNGNNKMAIQQAEKLLKKHKDLHCAKVLKAIGLQRTGKQDEAFVLAQEVTALEPTDDNSLQALTILYREMHRPELVTKLYEAAVRKVPTSEEYHSHLFMAYARVGEYKKMQQAGMALYKIVPKNPYYFWSVMSLIMQSISARDEKLSKTMFLPLAERMVEKMVKEDKIEAEAEVELYYMILERLGKYEEALEVIRGKLGEKLTSELQSRENKCMAMYKKLRKWPECNSLSKRLLLQNPDDWQFYLSYFDSVQYLVDDSWTPPVESPMSAEGDLDHTLEQAVRFVEGQIEGDSNNPRPLRGPHLAKLELIQRLRSRGCNDEYKLGEPEDLMFQYFLKFGDKPCCFTDLKVFVDLLSPAQRSSLINRLLGSLPLTPSAEGDLALPEDIKAMQRHLCVIQLSRLLGLQEKMDRAQKQEAVGEIIVRYRHGLQFGKSCLKTELQFSDYYCLIGAHLLLDLWLSGEDWAVWHALTLLEEGLNYLLTRFAGPLGHYNSASQACNAALRFFHSNQKDTSEYIIQAYKYGAFEKIPEFIEFRNRLNNSLHFAQVRTERMLLDLLLEANISSTLEDSIKSMCLIPEEDDIPWKDLRDNRDLTVLFNWDAKIEDHTEDDSQLSLEEERIWLLIRSLTLRLISGLTTLNHTEPKNSEKATENGVSSKIDTVRTLLQQFEEAVDSGKRFSEKNIKYHFLGPPASRLSGFLSSGCCQCQKETFQLVNDIYQLDSCGIDDSCDIQEKIGNRLNSSLGNLKDLFSQCKGDLLFYREGHCKTSPRVIENLAFFVEAISIVLWVSGYFAAVLRPFKSNLQKKKKKKKESSTMPPVFTGFQYYIIGLQTLLTDMNDYIKELEASLVALKLEDLSLENVTLSEEEKKFTKLSIDKVQNSYLHSLQEVGDLMRKKFETIKKLKL